MRIVSRAEWGARHDNGADFAPVPFSELWLHHSVTAARNGAATIRELEQIGENRFGSGISYTWLITPDGTVYEGHSVDRQGTHTGGRNDIARAICFVGNYESDRPTTAQIASAGAVVRYVHSRGWYGHLRLSGGHRDLKATACPGRYAYEAIPAINLLALRGNEDMKDLVLGQEASGKVWVGNGVTRRHVADPQELEGLEYWIERKGGDASIYPFADLRVLGKDATALEAKVDRLLSIVEGLQ